MNNFLEVIKFSENIYNLNSIIRYNFMFKVIPESVSAHSFQCALISLKLYEEYKADFKLDLNKMILMSLLHDVPEIKTGDLPYLLKKENKELKKIVNDCEEKYMRELFSEDIFKLFLEYNAKSSVESILVKISDVLSSYVYAKQELNMGNKNFDRVIKNCEDDLIALGEKLNSFKIKNA